MTGVQTCALPISEDSYSEEEEEEDEEDLPEDSDENGAYSTCSNLPDDSKAVAIIKSVWELSVPEKYKSTHQIRVRDIDHLKRKGVE